MRAMSEANKLNKPRGPNGGARPNSGPKKGAKYAKTLAKEAAREAVRQMVTAALKPLVEAQIANATGLKYLVTRDAKTGKFIRVGEAMAKASSEETIEIWEKEPSVQAFTDLLNRALDKPKEQEQDLNIGGTLVVGWKPVSD
jgi:hypothetical protein